MKKIKPKTGCSLGVSNSIKISKLVDKEIYPLVEQFEKTLQKIAKENKLYISGTIWVWET